MLICHSCGTPVESKSRQCHHCRNAISAHASVALLEPEASSPLKVKLELQPKTLDSLIASDLMKAASRLESSPLSAVETPIVEKASNGGNGENLQIKGDSQGSQTETDFFARLPQVLKKIAPTEEGGIKNDLDWQSDSMPSPAGPGSTAVSEPFSPTLPPPLAADSRETPAPTDDKDIKAKSETNWSLPSVNEGANSGEKRTAESVKASTVTTPANGFVDIKNGGQESNQPGSAAETINRRSFAAQNQEKIKNFNVKSSWPLLLAIGLVAIFVLFKGFEAFYAGCSSLSAASGNVGGQTNPVSGRWQFAARGESSCQGQMVIHQRGDQLYGEGIDNGTYSYKFSGTCRGDRIDLLKQYFNRAGFVGPVIQLLGALDPGSKPLFMHGDFKVDYMAGGRWRGKPVVKSGIWEAEMLQPLIEDDNAPVNALSITKTDPGSSNIVVAIGNGIAKNGLWVVVLIVVGGTSLWHFASSLIGPDGWLGIWDKQKYVPPQFMKEHKIAKRQLSQPLVSGSMPLGQRWEWQPWQKYIPWVPKDLALPPDVRANNPHILILGGGEKGKSRLMAHMIAHDIESADRAVVVVDSDGDLADFLLRWIGTHANGQELAKRVIVIDPTSNLPSPSFNPLELGEDADMQNAASAIVHGFKAIYHEPPGSQNQWSPQTAHILRNSAMLLMANGKTLIDLPTLLQDNDVRDVMLEKIEKRKNEKVEFATLSETWGQYKRLARTEQWITWAEPILNRVGATLTNLRIRPILTQSKGDIDLKKIITEKKVLIVKIPKGQLHDDANLLGSLIVTGLKQAAITLCTDGKLTDRTAALYLDEFDNFIEKETLDAITTETKKFQLGFVGSTKTLQHMPEDFRNQIVINIGTMCVFALSKKDGDMIGPQMFRVSGRKAKHRTLMNILNKVNTSPQFELISDEEKYNIDRILGQTERQFYAYRVGTVAGIFRMKSHDFNDIPDNAADATLLELMYKNR